MTFCVGDDTLQQILSFENLQPVNCTNFLSKYVDIMILSMDLYEKAYLPLFSNYHNTSTHRFLSDKLVWGLECQSITATCWRTEEKLIQLPAMKKRRCGNAGKGMKLIKDETQLKQEFVKVNRGFFFQKFIDTSSNTHRFNKNRIYVVFDFLEKAKPFIFRQIEFTESFEKQNSIVHQASGTLRDLPDHMWTQEHQKATLQHMKIFAKSLEKRAHVGKCSSRQYLFLAIDILIVPKSDKTYIIDINTNPTFGHPKNRTLYNNLWRSVCQCFVTKQKTADDNWIH